MLKKGIRVVICLFLCVLTQADVIGGNVIGGYLQMKTVDQTIGRYIISLKLHIDETNGSFPDNVVQVKMLKKSDGSEVESFKLLRTSSKKVSYDKSIALVL